MARVRFVPNSSQVRLTQELTEASQLVVMFTGTLSNENTIRAPGAKHPLWGDLVFHANGRAMTHG